MGGAVDRGSAWFVGMYPRWKGVIARAGPEDVRGYVRKGGARGRGRSQVVACPLQRKEAGLTGRLSTGRWGAQLCRVARRRLRRDVWEGNSSSPSVRTTWAVFALRADVHGWQIHSICWSCSTPATSSIPAFPDVSSHVDVPVCAECWPIVCDASILDPCRDDIGLLGVGAIFKAHQVVMKAVAEFYKASSLPQCIVARREERRHRRRSLADSSWPCVGLSEFTSQNVTSWDDQDVRREWRMWSREGIKKMLQRKGAGLSGRCTAAEVEASVADWVCTSFVCENPRRRRPARTRSRRAGSESWRL